MKLVLISDTHSLHARINVPLGDVLIHAGDATMLGEWRETVDFINWFGAQPHKFKIFVAGNHDWFFQRRPDEARKLIEDAGGIYLQDSQTEIRGKLFYGSPWQPTFYNWAFNLDRGKPLQEKWRQIPTLTDVLITHGPPQTVLDSLPNSPNLGDRDLWDAVASVEPKLHVFGHIHSGYGIHVEQRIVFVNAAQCDEFYNLSNRPIVIELE